MTAELKIGGKMARTRQDTGTIGTNVMSLNWAQSIQIQFKNIEKYVEIRMAIEISRVILNYLAKADIDI